MTRYYHPPSPPRRLAINWAFIEQRRIATGLSHTELRLRVGGAPVTGPPRLWHDSDHDTLELGVLERLCHVLDLHPAELFSTPTHPPQPDPQPAPQPDPPPATDDDQILEAALATLTATTDTTVDTAAPEHRGPVSMGALAEALQWPLARLDAALASLENALAERGQRIDINTHHQTHPVHGLRPRHDLLTDDQRQALHRIRLTHQPLDPDTARVLYTATQPDRCTELTSHHPTELLQQQGLIHQEGAHYLELTDDVRYSLMLDNPTEHPQNH